MGVVSVLSVLLLASWVGAERKFPPGFMFGAATSSYQIEGAWNESDKGESIWDRLVHTSPGSVSDRSSGDVATDSYHQWRQDVQAAHEMGLHFYRFSISWSRLLPSGLPNIISEAGTNYYNNLINGLLEKGIQPIITLYHWDLPQKLQDLGGWTNPLIVDWFADYAEIVYSLYADRVRLWITINEPCVVCDLNYGTGLNAPGIFEPELAPYLCNKHVLLAHAKAWRVYDDRYKPKYHGKMSLANSLIWMEAKSKEHELLTEHIRQHHVGRYSHPIYSKTGDWPASIKKLIWAQSKKHGYPYSRLPSFTKEEIKFIRGTYDFYGLNHYTTRLVRAEQPGDPPGVWFLTGSTELNAIFEIPKEWHTGAFNLLPNNPPGIRHQLQWLKKEYGNLTMLITENGYCDKGKDFNDVERIEYIRDYLEQVLLSINEDGVNVMGYTYWSLVDNFEWFEGYNMKFGLYAVDFKDPERRRSPRASAYYYSSIIKNNSLDVPTTIRLKRNHEPNSSNMTTANVLALSLVMYSFLRNI